MHTIDGLEIQGDKLVATVTISMDDKSKLVVTVPVQNPEKKSDVLAAIKYRDTLERAKYNAAPKLNAIVAEMAELIGTELT